MGFSKYSDAIVRAGWAFAFLLTAGAEAAPPAPPDGNGSAAGLASVAVSSASGGETSGYDGVVEAVRQTVIAAQVPGAVLALKVKAGDSVKAGQVLARLDARGALQTAAAGDAQVRAARAELDVATREVERQRQLFTRQYISQAALDRAEAQFKATDAQVASQLAATPSSGTENGRLPTRRFATWVRPTRSAWC